MSGTSDFRTKTMMVERKNLQAVNTWGIALDIGYSAVKGFAPNRIYCFPSYAKPVTNSFINLGESSESDIHYRDSNKKEWIVGAMAQNMITADDSNDSVGALYGRNRYFSPMFLVVARVGIAMGMLKNEFGDPYGKNLMLQTGLPPAYLKSDTALLKEALAGTHEFDIKIGNQPWKHFRFTLPENNIQVMPQPMGTLLSIATDNDGKFIQDAEKYFKSNILIVDPGFGTLDIFCIKNRMIDSWETFDELGMKGILKLTTDEIFKRYKVEIPIPAMQKYLETGNVNSFDRKLRKTNKIPFGGILEDANKKVCNEALQTIDTIYNNLIDYNYLVITGGTGAAWEKIVTDYYAGMENLKIIYGTQNDVLPYIFANVRGYYMYLQNKLRKSERA